MPKVESEEDSIADSTQESMHYYYKGLELFEEKKFDEAVRALNQFVTLTPRHVYADRAQFLVAESAYLSKEYGLAIVASNLLEARYPYSVRLPEAMHRRILSLIELKQVEPAKLVLEKMMKRYPTSPLLSEASKAMAHLDDDANKKTVKKDPPPLLD